jgi:hypothetical protein
MVTIPALHAMVLVLAGVSAPADELESLTKQYKSRVSTVYSKRLHDSARNLGLREAAEESRAKAWRLARKRVKAKNADDVWRFLLELDRDAGADDLEKHAREYLKRRRDGAIRTFAAELVALEELKGADDAEADEIIRRFDEEYEDGVLERGRLRAAAAEIAVLKFDIARAQTLYTEAIALPKSAAELAQEKTNHGSSWHKWWADRRRNIEAFKKDWGDLGGTDLDGESWQVSDYRGKVLIIDYWASW